MLTENIKSAYDDFYIKNDVTWRMLNENHLQDSFISCDGFANEEYGKCSKYAEGSCNEDSRQ